MREGWRLFLISAAVLAIVFALERMWVPGIVPVAWAEKPPPVCAVETAFVLRSLEFLAFGVALLSLIFLIAAWARRHLFG